MRSLRLCKVTRCHGPKQNRLGGIPSPPSQAGGPPKERGCRQAGLGSRWRGGEDRGSDLAGLPLAVPFSFLHGLDSCPSPAPPAHCTCETRDPSPRNGKRSETLLTPEPRRTPCCTPPRGDPFTPGVCRTPLAFSHNLPPLPQDSRPSPRAAGTPLSGWGCLQSQRSPPGLSATPLVCPQTAQNKVSCSQSTDLDFVFVSADAIRVPTDRGP